MGVTCFERGLKDRLRSSVFLGVGCTAVLPTPARLTVAFGYWGVDSTHLKTTGTRTPDRGAYVLCTNTIAISSAA